MAPSAVTGASLGDDQRTLTLEAQVPSGGSACVRELKAVLTDSVPKTAWVQITFSSPSGDRGAGCNSESRATTRVRLPWPLGHRDLIVDNDVTFTADGAGLPALRMCGKLGCRPPATGCTTASYEQALIAVDAPDHTYWDSRGCDGKWLVLDFSWRTGPACGDSTGTGCSSQLGDRWFFRAAKSGWVPIVEGAAGGCRNVQRQEPAFPTSLCASLAPLSASLHPSYPPPSASTTPRARPTASTAP
jgi:hypothetical protein